MRLFVVNSVFRERAVELTIADIAAKHGWTVTYVRPGNRRSTLFFTGIFLVLLVGGVLGAVLSAMQLRRNMAMAVIAAICVFLILIYLALGRIILAAQLKGGIRTAHRLIEKTKPNMIVATGYGAVIALTDPMIKRLPMVLITPGIGQYIRYMSALSSKAREQKRAELTLAEASFAAVAHDRRNRSTPIRDSLELVDTAMPGASEMDIISKGDGDKFDDETHIEQLILSSFRHGWRRLAAEERARFETREDGDVQVVTESSSSNAASFFIPGTSTPWLAQSDLRLLADHLDAV
eukprot:Gregarina_sp_Poly_1__1275@NODE_130_length_13255_cov_150_516454_g116_i0_p6_GENE_NODE_130_length_13255_cov_150_516454_g116_i0NODE_130_length_13255_cov_150_516454_g116_i0_p6_ORF_typecomplete_len293_score46_31LMBR1/PF04791_16/0_00044Wzy_C/PF04932_15/0_035ABC2_membrane_2/PF12679_7/0_043DUF2207/PF09972_9/0_073DUF4231/PF14015_6/2_2DUF4231/PF14015_6/3_6e03_NODE_130_length_13255_cov_150_516454_g116_i01178012658